MTPLKMNAAAVAIAASACALLSTPAGVAAAADAPSLAASYNCLGCHAMDAKLVGPSYKEIAAKYGADSGALAKLEVKVKAGSSGEWGPIPMPPNNVPDADIKTLVEWILSTK
ncbi:MAG TPA: c-type cytochrome [Gammaproteobacteria bacterium]|nr:c-type cytochrome [Gammaproteobacteria bacterium]